MLGHLFAHWFLVFPFKFHFPGSIANWLRLGSDSRGRCHQAIFPILSHQQRGSASPLWTPGPLWTPATLRQPPPAPCGAPLSTWCPAPLALGTGPLFVCLAPLVFGITVSFRVQSLGWSPRRVPAFLPHPAPMNSPLLNYLAQGP